MRSTFVKMFSRAFSSVPMFSSLFSSSSSPKKGPVRPSEAATPLTSLVQPVTRVLSSVLSFFKPVRSLEGASPRSILVKGDVRKDKPKKKVSWVETNTVLTVDRWLVPGVNVWSDEDLTDPSIHEFDVGCTPQSTPVRSFNPHILGAFALLYLGMSPLLTVFVKSFF
ncbi:uncharacterized protein BP01DRAFT_177306 [Aspergillus saccharolyticus JOP 1030-1]|uniref:Uncharacterized protein n=1 Tax=Aspergillus saccharolyticus JOP 1030-1 TaxID=1450539 RepID=A0A319ANV2_9EURO|nr:hypothetical protein BP01DRAFT_177306 [Aspergillus saccharolyticus JOP 1030-1]PYH48172.1 hypothetical protein BP01DRAFT_177306 [Aspergillus saccharolyticus JOP 1030-1]